MNDEGLMRLIHAPLLTEKTGASGKYCFRVTPDAGKRDIKRAVELMFKGIQVRRVCVCNVKGKRTSHRRIPGRCVSWKKAYVSLMPGQFIKELQE